MSDNTNLFLKNNQNDTFITEKELDTIILKSALLSGLSYTKYQNRHTIRPIANWIYPKEYQKLSKEQINEILNLFSLKTEGENIPPPISNFKSMKFPQSILKCLTKENIFYPTPIQMIGIPSVLNGRDTIAISFTGTGKTLIYLLPLIMMALSIEQKKPIKPNEGPFAFIIVPSRELAIQIDENLNKFIKYLMRCTDKIYPIIKIVLCIGGYEIKYQIEDIKMGCHIIIGTAGRLNELIEKKKLSTKQCKILVIDEAERLFDIGIDEDVKKMLEKFKEPRQTLIFSSSMPKKFQKFLKEKLHKPIIIESGKPKKNLKIKQEIEYIKDENKLLYLLNTLQKTPPPVIIFCENKNDVEEIHEYLLLKGCDVCSIHGDKDQESRIKSIREFTGGLKDILVATDIVSKGIHFPSIEHVINYDMPKEIENYILRIGRTGRLGKNGLSTTYINKNVDDAILLDLKHFLIECGEELPKFLSSITDSKSDTLEECPFCGGLGHKLNQCHKLENQRRKIALQQTNDNLIENLKFIKN